MTLDRDMCMAAFRVAVAACDPERRIRERLQRVPLLKADTVYGIAIGKAAQAMARGAGPVTRGVCVTHALDGKSLPEGWYAIESSHPIPDERSLAAGDAVFDIVASAGPNDRVFALISGGASALVERPVPGLSVEQFVREVQAVMASGAPIREINAARIARSQLKGGKLAEACAARITTLIASDVVDDDPAVIGSGPTVSSKREGDTTDVVMPIRSFAIALANALHQVGATVPLEFEPLAGPIEDIAALVATGHMRWGEPTVVVPADHGEGGRLQQLALRIAETFDTTWERDLGIEHSAFLIASDGMDGPQPATRPAPAGAFVDGETWAAIRTAGIDPARALARCDAGTALAAAGALIVTGPTGINFGDVVMIG